MGFKALVAISLFVRYRLNLRQMRIVTLINGLNNGGAEKFAVELCNELSIDHEVYLLVKSPINDSMIPPRKISARVHLIEFNSIKKWDLLFFLKLLFRIIRLKPQIIHLHSSLLVFYTFFYPVLFWRCRIFQTIHNQVTPAYIKVLKLVKAMRKLGCKMEQVVISEKIKQDYLTAFPGMPFSVIENGIKSLESVVEEQSGDASRRKKLLAIGHFGPAKRFDALVTVMGMPEISARYSLEIIGEEKGDAKPVTTFILSKALENVQLLGLQEHVVEYLKRADALVIWSSFEGMPLVMLEALSVGCPIISSPVGGIPDVIVSGVNGILTKGLDQRDLVEALNRFGDLTDLQLNTIRNNNQQLFKDRFSIETCAKNYECLFLGNL
jgi:glycosyltransferase involved in cell wall biosynthesis